VAENKPLLVIFAGPNGSGKSTLIEAAQGYGEDFPSIYINADDIAKERESVLGQILYSYISPSVCHDTAARGTNGIKWPE